MAISEIYVPHRKSLRPTPWLVYSCFNKLNYVAYHYKHTTFIDLLIVPKTIVQSCINHRKFDNNTACIKNGYSPITSDTGYFSHILEKWNYNQ